MRSTGRKLLKKDDRGMTPEQKQLLLKDLSTRLPYKVKCSITKKGVVRELKLMNNGISMPVNQVCDITLTKTLSAYIINDFINDNITLKPYLRPMSSMTDEEKKEIRDLYHQNTQEVFRDPFEIRGYRFYDISVVDWLNAHHFDYRGLIEKGLALEAPKGMYNEGESRKGRDISVPKTVDEAVKTLAKILSKEDRDYLLENGAISVHHSLGSWIRNEWGLWTGSELKDELMNMNKGLNHPDDMSNYIIEEFIKYCNNKL